MFKQACVCAILACFGSLGNSLAQSSVPDSSPTSQPPLVVHEKDLGSETASIAAAISEEEAFRGFECTHLITSGGQNA